MRLFGFELTRVTKAAVPPMTPASWGLTSTGSWWRMFGSVKEAFTGAWQRNIEYVPENVLSFGAVYACVTLIASDIAKVRIRLMEQDGNGIWSEVARNSPFWPVLTKPNHYQTRIKFIESWLISKLVHGNAYILKERDQRGVVTSLYVLDPTRVRPLVAPDGSVFYDLGADTLAGVDTQGIRVPASEIIHDVMVPLYHPLCGVSPISACGLAAVQGLNVQSHSTSLFANGANPGGLLVVPGSITEEEQKRLQRAWDENYSGQNAGKVAVLTNGLKYEQMAMSSVDAQLIDQLKWTAENVCTAYHVPPYMVGVTPPPAYNNIEALNQQYYAQCLQTHIESIELLLDEGLGLTTAQSAKPLGTEFDLDELLRMDTATLVKAAAEAIGSGGMSPNEARSRWLGLKPTAGGEGPYLQQQNYSLAALAKRDASADPFGTAANTPEPSTSATPEPKAVDPDELREAFARKGLILAAA